MDERASIVSRPKPELRARIARGLCSASITCLASSVLGGLPGCASIEPGRYGVSSLEFAGMQQMRSQSLRECLLTRERHAVALRLGATVPRCSEPPFSSADPELQLWTWGWTAWPTFNRSVFDQDLKRILRWYRARGFYAAEIQELAFDPPAAAEGNACRDDPCQVRVQVTVHEGEPVRVQGVELSGSEALPAELRARLKEALELRAGSRFDERDYDLSKQALLTVLREASFAEARVEGKVEVDAAKRQARVRFEIQPGAAYEFGTLSVTGQGQLPEEPILAAAGVTPGESYRPQRLDEIRVEVLALGAFSAIEVQETPDAAQRRMNLRLEVTPLSKDQLRLGVGVTSGASRRTETGDMESIPQWDVHLLARYELRHVLGTLGALQLEDQPRLIFGDVFPSATNPHLGNIVSLKLHEPGIIEARTDLFFQTSWDYGPDPFLGFIRSDIMLRLGARRGFFRHRLVATAALQQDLFVVNDNPSNTTSDGTPTPSTYYYNFLEQDLRLDLRDQAAQPSSGVYFALNSTESIRTFASDWSSWRIAPDARFYVPMPLSSVLALRFALGALFIYDAASGLDDISQRLGPSNYRLRGGGAYSVRGFLPGGLGAGSQGGLRRWESMLEWRLRLGTALTLAGFMDFGDVNEEPSFRFDHLNTSAGFGLRYFTLLGVLRVDAGFRVVPWQRLDGSDGIEPDASTFPFTDTPGALHFTIGDAF
jgi:outer membrane translocation and assembly module TamA